MFRFSRICRLAGLSLALLATTSQAAQEESSNARVIVRFKAQAPSVRAKIMAAGTAAGEARHIAQTRATGLGMRIGRQLAALRSLDERTHVILADGVDSATLARRLAQDSEVELVAVDHRRRHTATTPNDPLYAVGNGGLPAVGQWYLKAPAGEVVSSINAPAAWDLTTGKASVVVAVLDTGVRYDHPDLAGKLLPGYDMVGYSSSSTVALATANDGDLHDSDASDPGDWVTQADINSGRLGACSSDDVGNSSWHGTRVSGLIAAASNNGLGIAGVSWSSPILPVRVLGKCGGYDSDIIAGMKWAVGISLPGVPVNPNPARVLNLSLGGAGSCSAADSTGRLYREVISDVTARNAVVVVAAGNTAGQPVNIPGNCPGAVAVAALRHAGSKVGFSSLGPEVTISAPGGNCVNTGAGEPCLYPMLSTTNTGATTPRTAENAYTDGAASVGTSFSAPLVSGTLALMMSARPSLTPSEAIAALRASARPFVSTGATAGTGQCVAPTSSDQLECYCNTSFCGAGMLDAAAAVRAVTTSISVGIQTSSTPTAGQSLGLTATASGLPTGRAVAGYAWALVDGGGIVTGFSSASNLQTVTLTPSAAGTFVVRVTVTDDQGNVYPASDASFVVAAAPVTSNPPVTSGGGGGGGGGGTTSPLWLLGLVAAGLLLGRRQAAA
ncbi:S8 family serine peptidase [Pelomonas sp. SE-A7]|uniref:S8 family serine peptidase n=1 Tax=Pelomonas sp. SE-A7 TaxID=3054953 RepID=UPI00259CE621|nr:S8 family serine peptidase [Pelomonas sp. SE-A7]MDM4766896.1 S8 family serine peptidase [Pelomonas sp. SE-A7]